MMPIVVRIEMFATRPMMSRIKPRTTMSPSLQKAVALSDVPLGGAAKPGGE
jgi:hypothetical protein